MRHRARRGAAARRRERRASGEDLWRRGRAGVEVEEAADRAPATRERQEGGRAHRIRESVPLQYDAALATRLAHVDVAVEGAQLELRAAAIDGAADHLADFLHGAAAGLARLFHL